MSNTFGKYFCLTTFGESHGAGLGAVVDGLPAGLLVKHDDIQKDLDRRRPGQSPYATPRKETDRVEILSGLTTGGHTNGAPLAMLIRNENAKSGDYGPIKDRFRPGHADWPYFIKYGLPPQPGGGRSSGRETAGRVAGGAVARALLSPLGVAAQAYAVAIGSIKAEKIEGDFAEKDPLRFADPYLAATAHREVEEAISSGDSIGAVIEVCVTGIPAGWGDPVFGKLTARLGAAFFSIGAVRAVEFGEGISLAGKKGSESNDPIGPEGPISNRHGGLMGGLSTGLPIVARLYVKPTPSISRAQNTVNLSGEPVTIQTLGRHDPCLAPRLAPVAEAMALLTLADCYLAQGLPHIDF